MKLFHRTVAAAEILKVGFRDGKAGWLPELPELRGVWFSSGGPLDCNEGAWGDDVLAIDVPEDVIAEFEVIEEGKTYREFCIPATVANSFGRPKVVSEDDLPPTAALLYAVERPAPPLKGVEYTD